MVTRARQVSRDAGKSDLNDIYKASGTGHGD